MSIPIDQVVIITVILFLSITNFTYQGDTNLPATSLIHSINILIRIIT